MKNEILNLNETQIKEVQEKFAKAMKDQKAAETKEKVLIVDWSDDSVQLVTK